MHILPTAGPIPSTPLPQDRQVGAADRSSATLEQTARDFEAAFLSEALGHMGLDATMGVEGAAPFASFVNRAYASQLVEQGGIGLSESIVRALARQDTTAEGA